MLPVKIRPVIPKPWQIRKMRFNNKVGVKFFTKFCRLRVVKLYITLKPLNRFLYAAYYFKEETLGFLSMYQTNQSNAKITILQPIIQE